MDEQPGFVAIVVPALDEAGYIAACVDSLLRQWPAGQFEILVLDGGSTDATPAILRGISQRAPEVRMVHNPGRTQSAAMNLAARIADPRATVLIRADAHALYPADFVRLCMAAMREHNATSVVVPMRTIARPGAAMQQAIAAAQSSRLGNGGSAHRVGGFSGFVVHGHHAAFDRAFFRALGGYDEGFTHNEDAELDIRALAGGGRIWMCAEAVVSYFPRTDLLALARQYVRHGRGRARTLRKHGLWPNIRQMVPLAALGGCVAGVALVPFAPAVAAGALIYPAVCTAWGLGHAIRHRTPPTAMAGAALMAMHLGWATGFLAGFIRRPRTPQPVWRGDAAKAFDRR